MTLTTLLVIILIIALLSGGGWSVNRGRGYALSGGMWLVALILITLLVTHRL